MTRGHLRVTSDMNVEGQEKKERLQSDQKSVPEGHATPEGNVTQVLGETVKKIFYL